MIQTTDIDDDVKLEESNETQEWYKYPTEVGWVVESEPKKVNLMVDRWNGSYNRNGLNRSDVEI